MKNSMRGKVAIRLLSVCFSVALAAALLFAGRSYLERRRIDRLDWLGSRCKDLAAQQNWNELEKCASEWVSIDSHSAEALLNLAESYEKQDRLSECVATLLRVPERDPKAREAWLYASEMQLGPARMPSGGIETLARLRKLAPHAELVRKRLISLYAMTLQREQMIDEIRDAMQYHSEPPEAYVYLMIADHLSFTNGFQLNTQWLAAESESELFSVARAIQLADTLKKLETKSPETELQSKAAEDEIENLFQKYPANRALLNYLTEIALNSDDVERVGELLHQLEKSGASDSLYWRYKGWHFAITQNPNEAEIAYRRSLTLMPLDWHVWHELAGVLRKLARLDEAGAAAEVALRGKELRKACVALPDAGQANPELLRHMLDYAAACNDVDVAAALAYRFQ